MRFVNEHKMAVILSGCAILVIVILIYFGTHSSNPTAVEDAVMTTASPVQKFFRNIGRGFYDITHCIGELNELRAQNNELSQKNSELESKLSDNSELNEENDRLKRMLELRRKNDEYDLTACTVIADEPSNWFASFTVDKGRNSGIQEGQAVITADKSLVGKVTRVGTNWAEVMTIVDPGFSAGAKVKRSHDMGVAEGGSEIRESRQLKLSYLNRETDIETGDVILTTGLGGIFPDGLKIGTVVELKEDIVNINRYAILEPMVDLKDLREVFVITNNLDVVADKENENFKAAREDAETEQEEIDKKAEEERKKSEEESDDENSSDEDSDSDVESDRDDEDESYTRNRNSERNDSDDYSDDDYDEDSKRED